MDPDGIAPVRCTNLRGKMARILCSMIMICFKNRSSSTDIEQLRETIVEFRGCWILGKSDVAPNKVYLILRVHMKHLQMN